jgi:superfamily II DNA/RNA helicase
MYLPSDDPREYLHLAGRVGRIGQMGSVSGVGGQVTSILKPEEADQMDAMAQELGFTFTDFNYEDVASMGGMNKGPETTKGDGGDGDDSEVERMRRYLEDTITLLDLAEEPEVDPDAVAARASAAADGEDDDDDDDDDDDEGDDDDEEI